MNSLFPMVKVPFHSSWSWRLILRTPLSQVLSGDKNLLARCEDYIVHCKESIPKIGNKCSQKRNCAVTTQVGKNRSRASRFSHFQLHAPTFLWPESFKSKNKFASMSSLFPMVKVPFHYLWSWRLILKTSLLRVLSDDKNLLAGCEDYNVHCKEPIQKIGNKYSRKRNCAVTT